jgi:WW domain
MPVAAAASVSSERTARKVDCFRTCQWGRTLTCFFDFHATSSAYGGYQHGGYANQQMQQQPYGYGAQGAYGQQQQPYGQGYGQTAAYPGASQAQPYAQGGAMQHQPYQAPQLVYGSAPAAPASSEWKAATAPDGQVYYYNERTGETTWTKPPGML